MVQQFSTTITGSGGAIQLSTVLSKTFFRWANVFVPSGNSGTVQLGDSTVSASVGQVIAKGASFQIPPITMDERDAPSNRFYDATTFYVYVGSSDHAVITYAV